MFSFTNLIVNWGVSRFSYQYYRDMVSGSVDDAGLFLVLINKKREIHLGTRSNATGSDKVMFLKLRSVKKDIEIFPHGRLILICYARDM